MKKFILTFLIGGLVMTGLSAKEPEKVVKSPTTTKGGGLEREPLKAVSLACGLQA